MATSTDPDLIRRAAAGEPEALNTLWGQHRRWLAVILLAHMPAEAELDDLLQDVALSIVRSIATLEEPARIRPWLRAVAINAARSAGRRASVRRRHFRRLGETDLDVPDPAAERSMQRVEAALASERVLQLARRLPGEYREPLLLRAVRGLSQREIAETLQLPETTVETRLARARRMLREELAREGRCGRSAPGEVGSPVGC